MRVVQVNVDSGNAPFGALFPQVYCIKVIVIKTAYKLPAGSILLRSGGIQCSDRCLVWIQYLLSYRDGDGGNHFTGIQRSVKMQDPAFADIACTAWQSGFYAGYGWCPSY
jgi:hypothetical protein